MKGSSGVQGLVVWQVLRLRALPFAQDDRVGVGVEILSRAFGPLDLWRPYEGLRPSLV